MPLELSTEHFKVKADEIIVIGKSSEKIDIVINIDWHFLVTITEKLGDMYLIKFRVPFFIGKKKASIYISGAGRIKEKWLNDIWFDQ